MNGVNAVRHVLALSKTVFIADKIILFGILGCFVAAGGLEINGEFRAFFRSLDLSLTVIGVFDDK